MDEREIGEIPDDIDAELDRLYKQLDDNLQHLLTLINWRMNPNVTAVCAGWAIAVDERYYQAGDYAGADVAVLGRDEQPGYISRALIRRAFERQHEVVVDDDEDDDD